MSRWKASFIHLTLSAAIALTVLALMLLLWYAPPFFSVAAGYLVLLILLGVDVTLGPLITLIIFNLNKTRKALVFDFFVIAILQISALIYGVNVMYQARPVFVVFSKNSFDLITANMLSKDDIAQAKHIDYRSLPLTGPVYVYSEMPTDIKESNKVVMSAFSSGKDLPQFPQYYSPYAEHMSTVAQAAKPIAVLRKLNPGQDVAINDAVRNTGRTEAELGFIPLRAKYQDIAVFVGNADGKVLTTLPLRPW
jgi:hypothetical protein